MMCGTSLWLKFFCFGFVLCLIIMSSGCRGGSVSHISAPGVSAISIITTSYAMEYFAERVGGDRATVENLLKPGTDAHSFDPSPSDIGKLYTSDLLLLSGLGFEEWIDNVTNAIGSDGPTVINVGLSLVEEIEGVMTAGHDHGDTFNELDPHVWLDPHLANKQVGAIAEALIEIDPDGADVYNANRAKVGTELEDLDSRFEAGLSSCRQGRFITSHAAFGYLASRYGLEQVPISGPSHGTEPGPLDLVSIIDTIKEFEIQYVMREIVVISPFTETIAREVGVEVLPIYSIESLTIDQSQAGEDYFSLMDDNLEGLILALGCKR